MSIIVDGYGGCAGLKLREFRSKRLDFHPLRRRPISGSVGTSNAPATDKTAGTIATADDLVRVDRAAQRIGSTPGTVRSLVSRGQIPHIRLGKRMVRFSLRDLDAWIAQRRQPVGAASMTARADDVARRPESVAPPGTQGPPTEVVRGPRQVP